MCTQEESGKMLLTNAVEIGGRLTEAKERTTNRLMQLFKEYVDKLFASSLGTM